MELDETGTVPVEVGAAMTAGVGGSGAERWRELLPAGRCFVALPTGERPVVVAARDARVLRYVRTALLAAPPRSAVPAWAYGAAREALRMPLLWRAAPRLVVPGRPARAPDAPLAGLIAEHGSRLLVLRHSHDPDARTLLLLFGPGGRWPTRTVKLPDGPAAALRVLAEAEALRVVGALPLGALRETVPELVGVLDHAGLPALLTTALPGTPMLVEYHRLGHTARPAAVRADLDAAQAWLASFQSATAGEVAPLDLTPGLVDAFERRAAGEPEGARRLDRLLSLQRRLGRHHAPRTAVHGDFWPGNVLVHRGEVTGVVDWERSRPSGSPTHDLARLPLSYSHYLGRRTRPGARVTGHRGLVGGDPATAVAYALDGSGWYPDLVRAHLAQGLARLGLPAGCGRDAALAEVAALAVEATDESFADRQLRVFDRLSAGEPP